MKILTFKPPVAHLIVNGLLTQVKHGHGDYRRRYAHDRFFDIPRIDLTIVAIRASRYWMQPYEIEPGILSLLNSIGVTDTVNIPYMTIVGIVDVVSIERIDQKNYLWTFSNPRRVVDPVSDVHELSHDNFWLEGWKLEQVMDSLEKVG